MLDTLCQYIWQHCCADQTYNEFVEKFKHTSRSSQIKPVALLTHISWMFNININIIGFKRSNNFNFSCNHTTKCYISYYIFQNTIVKCQPKCVQIPSLVLYKQKLFVLNSTIQLQPALMTLTPPSPFLKTQQNTFELSPMDIKRILNKQNVNIPYSIYLYTSYYHITKRNAHHRIPKCLVDIHINKLSTTTLHIFLIPSIDGQTFKLIELQNIKLSVNSYNKFVLPSKTETDTQFRHASPKCDTLNQDHCICAHPETQRIFLPPSKSFKHLGTLIVHKIMYF